MKRIRRVLCGLFGALLPCTALAAPPPILETEESNTAVMPKPNPHWLYVGTRTGGVTIIDGDTAKIVGTVNASPAAGFALAPQGKEYYVSETIWTRMNRGTRQDLLSVYDGHTLNLIQDIELPGRLIASGRTPYFSTSADGLRGYVYNMQPASSIITIDLAKRNVLGITEIPACGLIYPYGKTGVATLCADGALADVAIDASGHGRITDRIPFFDAQQDPVFEESPVDRAGGQALFITFNGMVHPVRLGAPSTLEKAWSLQQAAGLSPATTSPEQTTWRPGGRRPFAFHPGHKRLYALMHEGAPWGQKRSGTELWVLDTATHQLVNRFTLPTSGYAVGVSEDNAPLLFVLSEDGWLWVMDPETGKILRSLRDVGRTTLLATDRS
ncbi:amine dehydrogenase [Gluconacetobacter johannae DSM 13595]|uniref:Amine dehydrogenase n=1 Tax=Gluconacetobacter johannae TaxID=112140 RepID=A0A7W4J5U1_9PROT|nr:amine dehydrogenase large subunit [Gluconacetobacter johannae]MBB2175237.1 amine dehydrogenase [Gluconacetobacter johannae]GBQ80760.1 amine dehydrogenase [Gluconacetobacter johannae DSM 13595]